MNTQREEDGKINEMTEKQEETVDKEETQESMNEKEESDEKKDETRCCLCLQTEHFCNPEDECLCVPLLKFCAVCKNDNDKRVCVSCVQTLLTRLTPQENSETNLQQQLMNDVLSQWNINQNTLLDYEQFFLQVCRHIDAAKQMFLHRDRLLTLERITLKAFLYEQYCKDEAYFCLVANAPDGNVYSNGMLLRVLIAQSFFPNTTHCELLSHRSEGFIRWIKNVSIKNVGLMTRLNLSDSSRLLSVPSLQYQNIHDRVALEISTVNSTRSTEHASEFVDGSIDAAIEEEEEDFVNENDQNISLIDLIQSANDGHSPLRERTPQEQSQQRPNIIKNQISCPMCRTMCNVLTYDQSAAEKKTLSQPTTPTREKVGLDLAWDLRRCQKELLFLFDRQNSNEPCRCCTSATKKMTQGGLVISYKSFRFYSHMLLFVLLLCFLNIDNLLYTFLCVFGVVFGVVFANYVATMKQNDRNVWIDGQVFLHCSQRVKNSFSEVLSMATNPGCFTQNVRNGRVLEDLSKIIDDVTNSSPSNGASDMPIHLVSNVHHSTLLGRVTDMAIQFLYANDTLMYNERHVRSPYSNAFAALVSACVHFVPGVVLFGNGLYRSQRCSELFKKFRQLLVSLKTASDICRFRLNIQGVTFSERMIKLQRSLAVEEATPLEETFGPWKFATPTDKTRFTSVAANDSLPPLKKMLLERYQQTSENYTDDLLDQAQLTEQTKTGRVSYFRYWVQTFLGIFSTIKTWLALNYIFLGNDFSFEDHQNATNCVLNYTRPFPNTLLSNTLFFKILLVLTATTLTNSFENWPQLFASVAIGYFRIEIVVLFIKILVASWWKNVWSNSNLVNGRESNALALEKAKSITINTILKSMGGGSTEQTKIDAISCD